MLKESYETVSFLLIPLIALIIIMIPKKKRVWLIPFVSFAVFLAFTYFVYPEYVKKNPGNGKEYDELGAFFWLIFDVSRQVFASIIAAVIGFVLKKIIKSKDDTEALPENESET
ncbi:MAG: hypothetical protein ACI4J2_08165 [Ruminococcus sp.]|nr:hypothetical protein [Oscillospiraceae bacterium]